MIGKSSRRPWILAVALAALLPTAPARGSLIFGDQADSEIRTDGTMVTVMAPLLRVGSVDPGTSDNQQRNAIFVFDLESVTGSFLSASLVLTLSSTAGTFTFNGDLYGVGFGATATPFPTTADFNSSATDTTNTTGLQLIEDNFVTPTTSPGQIATNTTANATLLAYLNTRPSGSAGNYVFFRVSQDSSAVSTSGSGLGYDLASANQSGTTNDPTLNYTASPEPPTLVTTTLGVLGLIGFGYMRTGRMIRTPRSS